MKPAEEYTTAIRSHAQELARDARGHLDENVPACPGWSVRDTLAHLRQVHHFWSTVADQVCQEPPDAAVAAVDDAALIDEFLTGANSMCDVLERTEQSTPVWTWSSRHDVAFITRHQYQEIVVHHLDVARVVGAAISMEPALCADAVDEFLHFSLSSPDKPADPVRPALNGPLVLHAIDTRDTWTLSDAAPGQVLVQPGAPDSVPVIAASAPDLLAWLYKRVDLELDDEARALGARLQVLSYTD